MSLCSACGVQLFCAMADVGANVANAAAAPCWCTQLPALMPVPSQQDAPAACYCRACLDAMLEKKRLPSA
jgi:hypothetical protein